MSQKGKKHSFPKMEGLLLFARYCFMPNRLGFCGPKENRVIFDSVIKNKVEPRLKEVLKKFPTALFYLKKIGKSNKIKDPFDKKVVEAYFIGNRLLEKLPEKPHHSFHVFNLPFQSPLLKKTLKNMENCLILEGKVLEIKNNYLKIRSQGLLRKNKELKFVPKIKNVLYKIKGKSFIPEVKKGDNISYHWGFACEILNKKQIENLKKYTLYHLNLVNEQRR